PIAGQHDLDTAACSPTDLHRRVVDLRKAVGATGRLDSSIGHSTCAVDQDSVRGIAKTATCGPEPINTNTRGSRCRATSRRIEVAQVAGTVQLLPAALEIGFNSDHPRTGKLHIHSNLTSGQRTLHC